MDNLDYGYAKHSLSGSKEKLPAETHVPVSDIYHALDPKILEFRLVELLPSQDFESTIECRLFHHDLSRKPIYEALSYVWGTPVFDKRILLNSRAFHITASLEIALRHLRSSSESRTLWVDALCINQNDEEERSSQVRMMRKIYQECSQDLVWVGPYPRHGYDSSKRFARGLKVVEAMEQLNITIGPHVFDDYELYKDLMSSTEDKMSKKPNLESVTPEKNHWTLDGDDVRCLSLVFQWSKVWNRSWIMQELTLAPEVTLVGGHSTLRWEVVSNFLGDTPYADAFHRPFGHGSIELMSQLFGNVQTIEHQRKTLHNTTDGSASTLLDVLARFKNTEATDPRDKIYAILGLVTEPHTIRVDYSKTMCEVFQEVTIQLINNSSSLDVLCQRPWHVARNSRKNGLPSWVLDFTDPTDYIPFFAQRSIYSAGDTACEVPCQVDNGTLRMTGALLGCVGQKLDEARSHQKSAFTELPRLWMQAHFGSQLLGEDNDTYCTGEPRLQAYWRTLVADCRAYPIRRLSEKEGEINRQDAIFKAVLRGEEQPDRLRDIDCYWMMVRMVPECTFTTSDNGLYLLVTEHVEQGDVIAVLSGAKVPVVLRLAEGAAEDICAKYKLIGTAYVHGLMDGEAKSWVEEGRIEMQDIYLA